MKTKIHEGRASQDITIDELPKQDNPNNSDLLVIQGASLTEATSIQQLRNKILGGEAQLREDLGSLLFSSAPISSPDYILMDGTEYTQTQYPIFYDWLLEQLTSIQVKFTVDKVAGTFIVPNYVNQIPYVSNSDNTIPPYYVGTNPTLTTNSASVFGTYCYIKANYEGASTIASPYIKTDGSVSMDLDYTPVDINDVATKKYIDNKLLDYQFPLSFSINDIGKKVPYYPQAENNPTLIALDGTKYLKSDYPDFDYNQEGFASNDTKFWFANIELEIKLFQNEIQPSSEWFKIPFYSERVKGQTLEGNHVFNSKMIYNFLNSPQGAEYLFVNDIFGDNAENNAGFTILAPAEYRIRANYNNWGDLSDNLMPPDKKMYKLKVNKKSMSVEPQSQSIYRLQLVFGGDTYIGGTGEVAYLKIKPDYMVAKIQQVGGGAIGGDLKSDRSVLLSGTGAFNTKQITAMDDLKAENIIYSNVVADTKAITTLKDKLDTIDTSVSTGSNDLSALQTLVNDLKTRLDSYDTKYRNFTSKRVKSGLNIPINSSPTVLTNLTQYFVASQNPTITSFGTSISGLPLPSVNLIEVGSGVNQGFRFPAVNGMINANVTFTVRITGSISGNTGTARELIVYLRRVSDNSIVANGGIIKVNDNNFNARSVIVPSFIQGTTDPFITNGFYLNLLNNSGGALTLTNIEMLIQGN